MMRISKKKLVFICVTIALLLAGYYFWWFFLSGDIFYTQARNSENRAALQRLYYTIDLDITYEQVLEIYWSTLTSELKIDVEDPGFWYIFTPPEFGLQNWVLHIEFADKKVNAVKIRTQGWQRPGDSPNDKEKKSSK